jgi:diguanylate cyclase (GGDEF)-like protein
MMQGLAMQPGFEEEEQRLRAVEALKLLDRPVEERFQRITRLLRRHYHAAASSITLVDRDRQFSVSEEGLGRRESPRDQSICNLVVEGRSPLVIEDLSQNRRSREFHDLIENLGLRFYAGVPLLSPEGYVLGSLCVYDHIPRRFSNSELEDLADFGAIVEDELYLRRIDEANQDLVGQLERLRLRAFVDALTGVWNRGALFDLLHREAERARRQREPLSVAMIDIDHFKRVNDSYGHATGDEVLKELCVRLRGGVRPYDALGRYGGEEFVVVFPHTGLEQAATQGERLRQLIEETPFDLAGDPQTITISLGIASLEPDDDTVPALLDRADRALYRAKRAGRNRVEVA